jgi:hypothetical protein
MLVNEVNRIVRAKISRLMRFAPLTASYGYGAQNPVREIS